MADDKKWWQEKPAEKVTTEHIISLDKLRRQREAALKEQEKRVTDLKQRIIVGMMQGLKTRVIEHNGYTVRVAQAEPVKYDDNGILANLSARQKRLVTKEMVDLNGLPLAVRKKILESLTAQQRREVTTVVLDHDLLSSQVQNGAIPVELVAKHTEVKPSAPYISSSGAKAK